MTAPTRAPATKPRPWTYTLMILTALGAAVVVWILASSAAARREDARRHEALRSELVRLDQAQSEWYATSGRYADSLGATAGGNGLPFAPSPNLLVRFHSLSAEAWNATATDTALVTMPMTCGIFRGPPEASPHRAVTRPGAVACW